MKIKCDKFNHVENCSCQGAFCKSCGHSLDGSENSYFLTHYKKAMISQPMTGLSHEEIINVRNQACEYLDSHGYQVVNTYFPEIWNNKEDFENKGTISVPLLLLAKALEEMSKCSVVYFCKGWKDSVGCNLEHQVAETYGIKCIYEEELEEEKGKCIIKSA